MSERAQTSETTIVRAAIYPAIGIARVGNSQSEIFLHPKSPTHRRRCRASTATRPAH